MARNKGQGSGEEETVKKKKHYPWWWYIKAVVRAYPMREGKDTSGVKRREFEAVQATVEATKRMADGEARLKVIQLVHWNRTHTPGGAAHAIPCHRSTALRWQRQFFEMVARELDLLD